MENMGAISEGELSSFSVMYTAEEAEFMSQPPNNSVSLKVASTFWPCHDSTTLNMAGFGEEEGSYHFSDLSNSNLYSSSHFSVGCLSQQSYYMSESMSMDLCMAEVDNSSSFLVEGNDCLSQEMNDGNAEEESAGFGYIPEAVFPDKDSDLIRCNNPSEKPKKRCRISEDVSMISMCLLFFQVKLVISFSS